MWLIGFRDLQWRRRRFAIAVVSTALLFAVSLLLSGISASFNNEVARTMKELDVDTWVVPAGTTGPFTSTNLFPASVAARVAAIAGVARADPILLFHEVVRKPKPKDVNMIGFTPGGVGQPHVTQGRLPSQPGEIVVDRSFGAAVGDVMRLGSRPFRVVGSVHGVTYLAGTAAAFVSMRDAQQLVLHGAPLSTAIAVRGTPRGPLPPGYERLSNSAVRADLGRPIASARSTISFLNVLLWIIAAGIIAAILYMSALERVREFAVIKAMGSANGFVIAGLASQAIVLAVAAAVVALALAKLIAPAVSLSVEIPAAAYVELFVVAISVGLLGSIAGLRKVLSVDPALAFG